MKNVPAGKKKGFNIAAYPQPDKIVDNDIGKTLLIDAIHRNDQEKILALIECGASINMADKNGRTPLHHAVRMGQIETVKILREYGATINPKNKHGETPLHEALTLQNPKDMIEYLLSEDANANIGDMNGRIPLHTAAHRFNGGIIQILAAATTNASHPDKTGTTPLHLASQSNTLDAVKTLLACGASLFANDKDGETPVHLASYRVDDAIIKYLVTETDGRKLVNAVNIVNGQTPLHLAVNRGNLELSQLMLKAGADPNIIDNRGQTPLSMSTSQWNPHFALAMALIENGADISRTSPKAETTVLIRALDYRNMQIARLLLNNGADPNEKERGSTTPLYTAIMRYLSEAVELLLQSGADPNQKSTRGQTPLHSACYYNFPEGIRQLLKAGADPNIADEDGKTALHVAIQSRVPDHLIIAILDSGADPLVKDKHNATPLDVAQSYGRVDIAEKFKKRLDEKGISYKAPAKDTPPPPPVWQDYPPYA